MQAEFYARRRSCHRACPRDLAPLPGSDNLHKIFFRSSLLFGNLILAFPSHQTIIRGIKGLIII